MRSSAREVIISRAARRQSTSGAAFIFAVPVLRADAAFVAADRVRCGVSVLLLLLGDLFFAIVKNTALKSCCRLGRP